MNEATQLMSFKSEQKANKYSPTVVTRKGGLGESPQPPHYVRQQLWPAPVFQGLFYGAQAFRMGRACGKIVRAEKVRSMPSGKSCSTTRNNPMEPRGENHERGETVFRCALPRRRVGVCWCSADGAQADWKGIRHSGSAEYSAFSKPFWEARGQKLDVLEVQNGWARISRYYDGSIEGVRGKVARWVETRYVSKTKLDLLPSPAIRDSSPERPLDRSLKSSDDYDQHRSKFLAASKQLILQKRCSVSDFAEMGGWVRSTRRKSVYFTYCGSMNRNNRIYLDVISGRIFR